MSSPASTEQFPPLTVAFDRPAVLRREKLSLSTEWLDVSTARIFADGEIDASNVNQFGEHVFARIAKCQSLVIDLRMVKFLGVECFSTLTEIDARCTTAGVGWTLTGGRSVGRVLDLCDPNGVLRLSYT